jgi:hypothetical protein|tara:strand:+ start:1297 stop:1503 length:207 start_codon:yes stop_codon:yes gene_type:complete
MKGLYKNDSDRLADILMANSEKVFSLSKRTGGQETFVPATEYERALAREEKAAATARLVINQAMVTSE